MKLTEILPLETWEAFEKEIVGRSGLDASVFGTDGVRITGFKQWANRLCPAIKATDRGQSYICAVAHMNLASMARKSAKPVIEECDAGLLKMVVPIFIDGEFVGAVGACGALLDDGEVDDFMINRTTGIDTEEILLLADGLSSISREKVEALSDFIQRRLAELLPGK